MICIAQCCVSSINGCFLFILLTLTDDLILKKTKHLMEFRSCHLSIKSQECPRDKRMYTND